MSENKDIARKKRSWIWWLILSVLLVLIIFLLFLITFPPLQKKTVQIYLDNLSNKTESSFSVDSVAFDIFSGVEISDFLVLDHQRDTLLSVGKFNTGFAQGIRSLIQKRLFLNSLNLNDVHIELTTYEGESISNLTRLLNQIQGESVDSINQNPNEVALDLKVDYLNMHNCKAYVRNQNTGKEQFFSFLKTEARLDVFDITNKNLQFHDLEISEAFIDVKSRKVDTKKEISISEPLVEKTPSDTDTTSWNINIGSLQLLATTVSNYNQYKLSGVSGFDPAEFILKVDRLAMDSVFSDARLMHRAASIDLKGELDEGVIPIKLSTSATSFTDRMLEIKKLNLKTRSSSIKQDVTLKYYELADFKNFSEYVNISADISPSVVDVGELIYFAPGLGDRPFFVENSTEIVAVSGDFKGRVESFNVQNLNASLGDKIALQGDVSLKNILDKDNAFLVLNIERGETTIPNLKELIPGFILPPDFNKLGSVEYGGTFNGFLYDFVTFGTLRTELGSAELDLRLDTKGGRENARYSGKLDLFDFDLKSWSGDGRFGNLTMSSSIKNGKGLNLDQLQSDIDANIKSLDFNGYTYQNVQLNGVFEKRAFNGIFNIDNEDVSMDFDGNLLVTDSLNLIMDLNANVKEIDLQKLHFTEEPVIIKGAFDLEMEGKEIVNVIGTADVDNLYILYQGKEYVADSLFLSSSPGINGRRSVYFSSDIANFILEGKINFNELVPTLSYIIQENFPSWVEVLQINEIQKPQADQDFNYKFELKDSREFLELFEIPCLHVEGFSSNGFFNSASDKLYSENNIEKLSCENFVAQDVNLSANYLNGILKSATHIDKYQIGENEFPTLDLFLNTEDQMVNVRVKTEDILNEPGKIDFELLAVAQEDSIFCHFDERQLSFLEADWFFDEKNEIVISKEKVKISNLSISDGYRQISLDDHLEKGLELDIQNIDFALVSPYIDFQEIDFSGEFSLNAKMEDIFTQNNTWLELNTKEFYLNDFYYGKIKVVAETEDFTIFEGSIQNDRKEDGVAVDGNFAIDIENEHVDAYVVANGFDLSFMEFIIKEGIKDTWGTCDVATSIAGPFHGVRVNGKVFIPQGGTTIDYLNNALSVENQTIYLSDDQVNLNNVQIKDELGNTAFVKGGLRHTYFKDWYTDVTLSSPRFIALNTTKEENPDYYGFGIGRFDVQINGPFERINMIIEAETAAGSELNIPVNSTASNYEESFITFIEKEDLIKGPKQANVPTTFELEGIDLTMNLSLTDDATVNIIFDEELNDIIKANGRGDMAINISRAGVFDIFGEYEITTGNYLFTALGGAVSKPFLVQPGSLITWTGDPINADIKIFATLRGLRTPLTTFLGDYLTTASSETQAEASKSTDVDLGLLLSGTLYQPEVSFDISFPEVTGELSNYVNSRVKTLKEDEADLNNQVAALLLFRTFIPESNLASAFSTNSIAQTGINILSDFLSGQLSYYVSGFLNDILSENSYITGIDFQVGANDSSDLFGLSEGDATILPDEVEVNVRPQFKGGRWGIDVGTNYVRNSQYNTNNAGYVVGDFTVEYYITEDRRLKMRIYGKYDLDAYEDITNPQRVQKYGVGLTYRREFGKMRDVKDFVRDLN